MKIIAVEIASWIAGILKKMLANPATMQTTRPIIKNLPKMLMSFLVVNTYAEDRKNVMPVPPNAVAINCPPLL